MNPAYKQHSPEDQCIEECAELIKAIQKRRRFGDITTDPFTGREYNNVVDVLNEMADVRLAMDNLHEQIKKDYLL